MMLNIKKTVKNFVAIYKAYSQLVELTNAEMKSLKKQLEQENKTK